MKKIILIVILITSSVKADAQIKEWFKKNFYPDKEQIIGVWKLKIFEKDGNEIELKKVENMIESIAFSEDGHVAILKNYSESFDAEYALKKNKNLPHKKGTWSIDEESQKITIKLFKQQFFEVGAHIFKYTLNERKKYSSDKSKTKFLTFSKKFSNGYYYFEFEKLE